MDNDLLHRAIGPTRDPSRAGAVWIAGTGAFLLLVASAVFVASNWDQIPPAAKLAAIGFLTGLCLLAGRRLGRVLPATSGALYHLGAFLIPVDVAAFAVHLDVSPEVLALALGAVCAPLFWLLHRAQPSVLLRFAAAASVVPGVLGFAGVTGLPAGPLLAGAACVALVADARRAAIGWALVAAVTPVLALGPTTPTGTPWYLEAFSLSGTTPTAAAVIGGLLTATVLFVEARRRRDPVLAVAGIAALALGGGTSWGGSAPTAAENVIAAGSLILGVELLAAWLRSDRFWGPITHLGGVAAEMAAAVVAAVGAGVTLAQLGADTPPALSTGVAWSVTFGLTAAAWLVADLRRRSPDAQPLALALLTGNGFAPTTVGLAACLVGGVATVADPLAVAVAMAATAGALVCSGRRAGHATAAVLMTLAPLAATGEIAVAAALGFSGSLLLAWAATLRRDDVPEHIWMLSFATVLPVAAAATVLAGVLEPAITVLGAVTTLWLAAAIVDTCAPDGDRARDPLTAGVGNLPRAMSLLCLLLAPSIEGGWIVPATLVALGVAETWRRRDPLILASLAVSLPAAILLGGLELGAEVPDLGLVLVLVGSGWALATWQTAHRDDRWFAPAVSVAITCSAFGTLLVLDDPAATASWALLVGAAALGFGVLERLPVVAWIGAALGVAGVEGHLALHGVMASEPYLAPICAALVVLGFEARRRDTISSWLAYGPAVALLGGAAVFERITGGSPNHALVAGTVGVAAVAIGGWRRLAAPMFLGTSILVATAGYESLAVTASLPTWVWLATGGALLLAAGILLERADTGPIEGGRRLVDVVGARFD